MARVYLEGGGLTVEQLEQRLAKLEAMVDRLQQMQRALKEKLDGVQHRVGLLDHRF